MLDTTPTIDIAWGAWTAQSPGSCGAHVAIRVFEFAIRELDFANEIQYALRASNDFV